MKKETKKSKRAVLFSWLFPLLVLMVSLPTLCWHAFQMEKGIQRSLSAVETQGVVLDTYRTPGGDTSDLYHVAYQFEADGKSYQNTSEISWKQMQQLEQGDFISVFYLPEQPENSEALQAFDFDRDLFQNLLIAILALLFFLGGICMLWGNFKQLRAKRNSPTPPAPTKHFPTP